MKASNSTTSRKQFAKLASSFSLTEKSAPHERSHDERNQIGILTSGILPRPRLPSLWLVALGVCNPLQWRNRPRFSRGSLTFDCLTKSGKRAARFKERLLNTGLKAGWQPFK